MKLYRNGEIWDFEHEIDVPGHRPVILGLDGGTTSTVCICMPVQPFSNPLPTRFQSLLVPSPVAPTTIVLVKLRLERHWSKFLADALSKSGSNRSAVQAVCLAVSGVNHPTDEQRIFNWLRDIFPSHVKLYVQNDAVAALASGTMGKLHGCVLIAGTGTIAYGFTEHGREARAAGSKGHHVLEEFALLGSIGGLISINMALYSGQTDWAVDKRVERRERMLGMGPYLDAGQFVRAHDCRGPETILTSSILHTFGLCSPDELIGWTYADPSWARIAACSVIVSCAEAFDEVANKILQDSVEELALSVKAVVQRLGLCGEDNVDGHGDLSLFEFELIFGLADQIDFSMENDSFPLVMVGGVLEANKTWDIGKRL
ncbi:hypothetical protein GH714_033819 [Hevea brasiliensis]|uniref:N-acetyl-D-glucosamine kinase n=1 Tax=Hevea brasiliensis TaxID=3981 RepID=A0A6A6LLA8_HEVBR|nr:hypothetical protein GH714_033819 [Hevea brasiliensis]